MKKRTASTAVVISVMVLVCLSICLEVHARRRIVVNENQYATSGRINNNFSYNSLDIRSTSSGCVFRGTITNDSSVLQAVNITVQAVDAAEEPLWRHTISLPALGAGTSYQFEDTISDCPDTTPYRLRFEISQ